MVFDHPTTHGSCAQGLAPLPRRVTPRLARTFATNAANSWSRVLKKKINATHNATLCTYIYTMSQDLFLNSEDSSPKMSCEMEQLMRLLKRAWSDTATSWTFGPLIQFVDPGPNDPKWYVNLIQFAQSIPINYDKLILSGCKFSVFSSSRSPCCGKPLKPFLRRDNTIFVQVDVVEGYFCNRSKHLTFMAPSATSTTFYEFLNLWPTSATKESMTCWLEKDGDIACSRQFIAELNKCFTFDPKTPVVGVDLGKIWTNCLLQANVMASQPNRCCFYSGLLHSLIFSWFLRSHGWKNKDYKQGGLIMINTSEPSP